MTEEMNFSMELIGGLLYLYSVPVGYIDKNNTTSYRSVPCISIIMLILATLLKLNSSPQVQLVFVILKLPANNNKCLSHKCHSMFDYFTVWKAPL
jgi:hypothetical protein